MTTQTDKLPIDGATLSPKLKPKRDADPNAVTLPIGKSVTADGKAVARIYKHAAGKSSTYSPQVVDMIYHMSRQGEFDTPQTAEFVEAKLAAEREISYTAPPATWDQLVFLSANLTRLVIDPYREKCNSKVILGADRSKPLTLDWPIVFGQVDFGGLPETLLKCTLSAAKKANLATAISSDWAIASDDQSQKLMVVDATSQLPDLTNASAVEITAPLGSQLNRQVLLPIVEAIRLLTKGDIPIGIVAPASNAAQVIDKTIDLGIDFYVCDGQWTQDAQPASVFPELSGSPNLNALTATVECLRKHCREDIVQVIYRGGIRGGADAGKALCLGATVVTLGLSAIVGMGFQITRLDSEESLIKQLSKSRDEADIAQSMYHFAKSVVMEVTMLARACGKSSVANMEPEDLRALTIDVSAATGIPLAGTDYCFRSNG